MDIVDTVASIDSIFEITTRSLFRLYHFQMKIKDAPIALTAFIANLSTTNATLRGFHAALTQEAFASATVSPSFNKS